MLPFAAAMMIVSPLSAKLVERIGTKITVALGLGLVTTGLLTMIGLQADTPYANIFWRLMLMAAGMGLTMAPATDSVMGSLPLFKAGVGSAVNDTTRQVGGALGVAVVGSVLATTYGSQISAALAENGIVGPVADAAKNSIGAISTVAPQLQEVANAAFVDAVHWGVFVAAMATAIGVVIALVFLPARARPEDREEQIQEYTEEHTGEFPVAPTASADAG
jgi:MFS family permease